MKQLIREYKCIQENLLMYFFASKSLLKIFDLVGIKNVPWLENQEPNDLAQIASGYRVSEKKLEELIEVK